MMSVFVGGRLKKVPKRREEGNGVSRDVRERLKRYRLHVSPGASRA
jgi:hypothetical protein